MGDLSELSTVAVDRSDGRYGTDYPFGGANGPANIVRNLQRCGFTASELSGIERGNALRILPKRVGG